MECGALTSSGSSCKKKVKQGEKCCFHREYSDVCPVCLSEIKGLCKKLPCNHEFHKKCIHEWESKGNNTCPCCRAEFSEKKPHYKVTVIVENINTQSSREYTPTTLPDFVQEFLTHDTDLMELVINVESEESLQHLMHELGISAF